MIRDSDKSNLCIVGFNATIIVIYMSNVKKALSVDGSHDSQMRLVFY